jgi:hypothetical protein
MDERRSPLLISILGVLACAGANPESNPVETPDTSRIASATTPVRARSASRLHAFEPRGELVLEGGECTVLPLPREGVRRLNMVYPYRGDPKSAVTIMLDENDRILHYVENRGLPGARRADGTPVDPSAETAPRTTIQLDYVTGEGLVVNRGGTEPDEMIRTTTAELEAETRLGDFAARAAAIYERCNR